MDRKHLSENLRLARGVLRAQLGERAALEGLLLQTQDWLLPYLRGVLRHEQDAEEVLQDVLLRVHRKLRWLSEPRAYRVWTYRIATREALRYARRRGQQSPESLDLNAEAVAPEPPQLDPASRAQLWSALDRISPNTRAVLVLHYREGLSLARVADILDLPTGTVKSRLAAGLAAARQHTRRPEQ